MPPSSHVCRRTSNRATVIPNGDAGLGLRGIPRGPKPAVQIVVKHINANLIAACQTFVQHAAGHHHALHLGSTVRDTVLIGLSRQMPAFLLARGWAAVFL